MIHQTLLHLPILTTIFATFFSIQLFSRYRAKGGGPHLLWWGLGMVTYGIGTFTEAYTTLLGWDPLVFRCWYVAGAFLGGYPLAQGSIYLLMNRRFANASAWIVSGVIAVGAVFVFLTPLNVSLAEAHRLSGQVIEWRWIRFISPFINLYALAFLAGGAVVSALRYRKAESLRNRYVGNIFIAIGAILPGIGGTMTRAGYVEVLYVTELIGLLLIYAGYRKCVSAPAPQAARARHQAAEAVAGMVLLLALAGAPAFALPPQGPAASDNAPAVAANEAEEAEASEESEEEAPQGSFFARTTVTATGSERDAFEVVTPVTVIPVEEIVEKAPDNAADLLRQEPGVDVNGVGPNQARPIIRGQRGLRVLFLEDGLRMNNARRQSDFGEITGLVDLDTVRAVEVVRGPASVLYGSDAIGGVLNLVTRFPTYRAGARYGGSANLRASSADEQQRVHGSVDGRPGKLAFSLGFTYRDTEDYEAAAGSFGDITLDEDTRVVDTGVQDDSLNAFLGYRLNDSHDLSLRASRYRADETGFGFVEPEELGMEEDFRIRILYPFQRFDRLQLSYLGSVLGSPVADSLDVKAYFQQNERSLVNDIDINIGPIFPGAPDSSVEADTENFTDLDTFGLRAEAVKLAGEHLLTYGLEFFEDDSFNTDRSVTTTTIRFPFPPFEAVDVATDTTANAPNATNASYGFFLQDEVPLGDRFKLTVGARYQNVDTKAEPTPGWDVSGLDFSDDNVVGSLNLLYQVNDNLNLLAAYGTAFRAPNIIERLFNGPTPEGAGFQILNSDLMSEESENIDLGFKYRRANAFMELVLFRTEIDDGIIQYFFSPEEVAALPPDVRADIDASGAQFVVQQRNADRLRYEGLELALGYRAARGWSVGGNYTYIDAERIDSSQPPTGDTFGEKISAYARYEPPRGRFWVEYRLRHNGDAEPSLDPDEPVPPVGEVLPSFTIHTLAGGVTLFERGAQRHSLIVLVDNLTDELYAEFSNATFFRPQPRRNIIASYRVQF